jgi:outer membrane protein TolC
LALTRDTTLQAAVAQRDAEIEKRLQAISQLLPQLFATGSATRERITAETIGTANGAPESCTQSSASFEAGGVATAGTSTVMQWHQRSQ